MAYTGVIRFIGEMETSAIVDQTLSGSTYKDGYRYVKADFSGKAVDGSISYSYDTESAQTDGYSITIV